jgi:hypothetical protein
MKRKTISTYLYVLGIVQLVGLNLGGFFWLAWASGIRKAKNSSRRWVIGFHSIYLALCVWALSMWIGDPSSMSHLKVFGRKVATSPFIVLAFIFFTVLIYGLPVVWLMNKKVKQEFIEQDKSRVRGIPRR